MSALDQKRAFPVAVSMSENPEFDLDQERKRNEPFECSMAAHALTNRTRRRQKFASVDQGYPVGRRQMSVQSARRVTVPSCGRIFHDRNSSRHGNIRQGGT
jgi:hypothetical protein